MASLLHKRFLFVVGKGGVGKTTVSAALAIAAARSGKRTLLAMANAKERLSHLLETEPIGEDIVEVEKGLFAVNMTPAAALEEYGMMILKMRSLYRAIFENRIVKAFLRGTPGVEAWSMLGKAYFHAMGHGDDGKGEYDLVILDAPATGHGLDMLRVPQVIVDVAPPGLLRREAERALRLFRDSERSGVVLVTLAEDMPANETIHLHTALQNELRLPVLQLVVNGVVPKLFNPQDRAEILELASRLPADSPLMSLARAGRARALRERTQQESMNRLFEAVDVPPLVLPFLFAPQFRRAQVDALSRAFD